MSFDNVLTSRYFIQSLKKSREKSFLSLGNSGKSNNEKFTSLVLNIFLRNCNVNALSPWLTEVKDIIKAYLLSCQKMHPITSVARKFKNLSEKSWWIIPSKYIFLQHLVWWYIYQEMTLSPLLPIRVGPSLMHTQENLKHLVTIRTWCSFYSICYYLEDRHDSQ